ncbi:exodeoxyribonuclease I [Sarracenia purpurea var. burkii]
MITTITDYHIPDGTHDLYDVNFYDVNFFNPRIQTLVTHTPAFVASWISEIERIHSRRLHRLIVGLDVKRCPYYSRHRDNPIGTLQLCVGRRCLIFQLIYAPFIPSSLLDFLGNPMYTFVGVGIDRDADKLAEDYGLWVGTTVDLGSLAAQEYGVRPLRDMGLKELARHVLGKEIEKPWNIRLSWWDNERLNPAQVVIVVESGSDDIMGGNWVVVVECGSSGGILSNSGGGNDMHCCVTDNSGSGSSGVIWMVAMVGWMKGL